MINNAKLIMNRLRFRKIFFALISLVVLCGCTNDDDSDSENTLYTVEYGVLDLGDIPTFAVVDIKYVSDFGYEITAEDVENYPWYYTANSVMGNQVTMTISFTKRVPFTQNLDDEASVLDQDSYTAVEEYSIVSSVMYSGVSYSSIAGSNSSTVSSSKWEAYIDNLVENPIVITLNL